MFLPLREINIFGMFVDPAVVALVVSVLVFCLVRTLLNRCIDLNRFVWRRPLVDIALLVILYCFAILTLRPI
jgi:accessory gene regulator protein AgrB